MTHERTVSLEFTFCVPEIKKNVPLNTGENFDATNGKKFGP
jgi:hypothetical protein